MTDIKHMLGKRIKELRQRRKYTQEKLAEMAGIEIPSLSNIENGKNYPGHETLQKICTALDIYPYELYMFEYYKPKDVMIKEMVDFMNNDELLTQQMYKYFICVK